MGGGGSLKVESGGGELTPRLLLKKLSQMFIPSVENH